jgi:hypothetical protein
MKQAKEFSGAQAVGGFFGVPNLDKIEQLGTSPGKRPGCCVAESGQGVAVSGRGGKDKLKAKAKRKYHSNALACGLSRVEDSPLKKSYGATVTYCASQLIQEGTKFTSKYCGHRWCNVCNGIRMAQLIKGYEGPLSLLVDKWFVTLTIPNVPSEHLREAIEQMIKQAQAIQGYFKKRHQRGLQGWQLVGLRKLECTHNVQTGLFHPHFHLVVQGEEAARALISEWLKRVDNASPKAQDMRKAGTGSEKELFKYFAKTVTKMGGEYVTLLEPLDIIFQAMRGLRVFQPIGLKKYVSEEVEDLQAEDLTGITPSVDRRVWQYYKNEYTAVLINERTDTYFLHFCDPLPLP